MKICNLKHENEIPKTLKPQFTIKEIKNINLSPSNLKLYEDAKKRLESLKNAQNQINEQFKVNSMTNKMNKKSDFLSKNKYIKDIKFIYSNYSFKYSGIFTKHLLQMFLYDIGILEFFGNPTKSNLNNILDQQFIVNSKSGNNASKIIEDESLFSDYLWELILINQKVDQEKLIDFVCQLFFFSDFGANKNKLTLKATMESMRKIFISELSKNDNENNILLTTELGHDLSYKNEKNVENLEKIKKIISIFQEIIKRRRICEGLYSGKSRHSKQEIILNQNPQIDERSKILSSKREQKIIEAFHRERNNSDSDKNQISLGLNSSFSKDKIRDIVIYPKNYSKKESGMDLTSNICNSHLKYEVFKEWNSKRKEKIEKMKEKNQNEEMKEATFSPKITSKAKKITTKGDRVS